MRLHGVAMEVELIEINSRPLRLAHSCYMTHPPYDLLGGAAGVRALVDRFYALMGSRSQFAGLRALHETDIGPAKQHLFEFLSGWLGGPPLYFQQPGRRCVMSAHLKIPIGVKEANQWISCMLQALEQENISQELRDRLMAHFSRLAHGMRNSD
jgi:hemoglobin